eukprot:523962-Rhodomonas_salina.1
MKYFDVVYDKFCEIGFMTPNPEFDPNLEWTRARADHSHPEHLRLRRGLWTANGMERTISVDETETTCNQSRGGSKKAVDGTLVAKKVEIGVKG